MKPRPTIFLSGASSEFATFRNAVENEIKMKGCFAENQPGFPPDYRTVEEMLRRKINESDAVIHIVGFRFGDEPRDRPAGKPRRSYTQMEFDIARELEKPVFLFFSASESARDKPKKNEKPEDAELRRLQIAHRDAIKATNNLRYSFSSKAELCKLAAELQIVAQADFRVDVSRIQKYAPAELIGREDELKLLDDAWLKVRRCEARRPHVLTFVALGGEGKTSLVAKWTALLAHENWPGCDAAFAWSFYSQGTREQQAASSDLFLKEALAFFGDLMMASSKEHASAKGKRLAELVGQRRSLLILDGLEPLQYAPTAPTPGELKDQGLAALLKGLAAASHGLCLVTTRYSIHDLRGVPTAPEEKLKRLSKEAGGALLRSLKTGSEDKPVKLWGNQPEFEGLVEAVKGHALTLNIIGSYLLRAFGGDIRQRDRVKFEKADEKIDGGHAFRAMAAYAKWMEDDSDEARRELAILRCLGLFDRPATRDCLDALLQPPAIADLTAPLVGLPEDDWNWSITALESANLASLSRAGSSLETENLELETSLDTHPHIREYFAKQLREKNPDAWRAAHRRLYKYLCESTLDKPQPTLEDLQPLYQAVAHGCSAEQYQEALNTFFRRIIREKLVMRERPLGASPIDLECLSRFTGSDWNPKAALNEEDQRFVLHEVAHYLFLLGRLNESSLIFPKAVSTHVAAGKWGSAAAAARLSSDLYRELGRLDQAQQLAEQAIHYARQEAGSDQTQTGILRICMNTAWLGLVHYLRGEAAVADGLLKEAEHIEKSINRDACFLTSFPGWCFCERLMEQAKDDFKLKQVELTEPLVSRINNLQERASFVRRIGESQNRLLDVAQAELILGQLLVLKHLLNESVSKCEALSVLKGAVCKLRRSGQLHHVAYGLVRRAEMNGLLTQYDAAQADLDEAWEIAERGPMRLHMADILLTRCRLFGMPGAEAEKGDGGRKYPWDKNLDGSFRGPKDDLAEARKLIERCGYWRRKEELEDAERALGG